MRTTHCPTRRRARQKRRSVVQLMIGQPSAQGAYGQSSSSSRRFPEWQRQYEAAVLELDRLKCPKLIAAAEAVIFTRLQVLAGSAGREDERQAIDDALNCLRILKGEIRAAE
jgi:hypothetical protein